MDNNFACKKCNSTNTKIINEPIEIEKNCNYIFIVFFLIFTIISIVGIIITIKSLIELQNVSISTYNNEDAVKSLVYYYKETKKAQNKIYTGLIIFAVGLLPQFIMAMLHSLATKYSIKNKTKILCLDCRHKINFSDYFEEKANTETEEKSETNGN